MELDHILNFKDTVVGQYTENLGRLMPRKLIIALFLMVLMSINEALSLLILIPLLQLVGLDFGQESLGQITGFVSYYFNVLGFQPTLFLVLVLYVVIVSIGALLMRWQTLAAYEIEYKFAAYIRKRLYKAITNTNWLFFTRIKSSDFAHALTNEVERISTGTYMFLNLIASVMILLVYIIFSLKLAGIITGGIFLVGVVILLLLMKKVKESRTHGEEITTTTRDLYSSIMQHLDGMKTIKSFNMQKENVKLFSHQTETVAQRYLNAIRSYADVKLLFDIGTVVVLAIMVLVLIQVVKIPTATLLLLIYIFVRMIPQFSSVQNSYQYFINMLPAFRNVMDLEERCLENTEIPGFGEDKIQLKKEIFLENVSFSYGGEEHFNIHDLNLHIPVGKTTAIAGPSGAGKSTVADLLMGLIQPVGGQILIDGIPVLQKLSLWRNQIGYVAQETFLFNETIRFNLSLASFNVGENDLIIALKMASAYEFVSKLPDGMDTLIGDRGVRLSGGERQRLALARALLRKPSLLILDEATSNLDSENEKRIIKAIDDLQGDMTIVVIAHRLSTIKNSDYIYMMEHGQVVEEGSWDELLTHENGKFRGLCLNQGLLE